MRAGMIEVTGVALADLIKAAYNPSRPQGLGFLHFQEGDLTDAEVEEIIARGNNRIAVRMDYVKGRSCKFTVTREGDKLFIANNWYDHSTAQLEQLLTSVGLSADLVAKARKAQTDHEDACVEKALKMLAMQNDTFEAHIEHPLDEDIALGLFFARDRGLVTETYAGQVSTWTLLKAA